MDILPDGSLDYDNEILAELDVVIASIHTAFGQKTEQIMHRLITACKNPYVNIIAHPTGRLIGLRPGYSVDIDLLIKTAKETNTILELNASPKRFDLPADSKSTGSRWKISVNTDSHHMDTLKNMEIGIKYARKAWLRKETIINTYDISQLRSFLKKN